MEAVVLLIVFFVPAIISGAIGAAIGSTRGRAGGGFCLGLFLGPIGWIIAALLPKEGRRCPFCQEVIAEGAVRCPHCRSALVAVRAPDRGKVAIRCPGCGARYQVAAAKLGEEVSCPKCGTAFTAEQDQ